MGEVRNVQAAGAKTQMIKGKAKPQTQLVGVEPTMPLMQRNLPAAQAKKPGRNDPCPCESGKKYKRCCA